jgi:hypothetical protein
MRSCVAGANRDDPVVFEELVDALAEVGGQRRLLPDHVAI